MSLLVNINVLCVLLKSFVGDSDSFKADVSNFVEPKKWTKAYTARMGASYLISARYLGYFVNVSAIVFPKTNSKKAGFTNVEDIRGKFCIHLYKRFLSNHLLKLFLRNGLIC